MNLTLTRYKSSFYGIFGQLTNDAGNLVAYTLEHSYPTGNGFISKIPAGEYICKRGKHIIHDGRGPFETFEVTGVPGHTGILFHAGNYNGDSEGCILLGAGVNNVMVTSSRQAFRDFMNLMDGVDGFKLTVS